LKLEHPEVIYLPRQFLADRPGSLAFFPRRGAGVAEQDCLLSSFTSKG
jgi:hypothetical protein